MTERGKAGSVLTMNTLAFVVCFAAWMMNGVLVTFLVESRVFTFDKAQIGWLLGIPVLTGSIVRLPIGLLTDRYGGRIVYPFVMLAAAAGMLYVSFAQSYSDFLVGSLAFGLAGTGFAVGIAYTSVWFKQEHQGTALGIFGAGNAGSAVTSMGAPILLRIFTDGGSRLDGWRSLPRAYAVALVVMTVIFALFTHSRRVDESRRKSLGQLLAPLKEVRVWRFGLYYFFVFGGFVALSQWLIPYYVNVYPVSVATAGLLAAVFSLPSGLIRAIGGFLSDRLGARTVMYWILGISLAACLLLIVPRMEITSPGEGIVTPFRGKVVSVTASEVVVDGRSYKLKGRPQTPPFRDHDTVIWPRKEFWQEPLVAVGDTVARKQVLARGITRIHFQANIWIFTFLVLVMGVTTGIGKAAVYKYIPEYFPKDVGVVGGIVGVIGGLGGFVGPIAFGYMLKATGLWTTCWMFLAIVCFACIVWLHLTVRRLQHREAPHLTDRFEGKGPLRHATPDPAPATDRDKIPVTA